MSNVVRIFFQEVLKDIKVELGDEFDRNFERQGFFSSAWQRRKSYSRPGGAILIDTGRLRQSIKSQSTDNSITFSSDLPYASIHNEGGEITVTPKMKAYFWFRYKQATGSLTRKKNGALRENKRNASISDEAEFYKRMALMKVGKKIQIPRRRFIGTSPELEAKVNEIIEKGWQRFASENEIIK